nr:uncharacterized protein LOC109147873 [Ipomoea batatas]
MNSEEKEVPVAMDPKTDSETEATAEGSEGSRSSESPSEMIKINCGNLELPVHPSVLDDLMERSKKGEGDMETLLSKYVMGELANAIKRKTETMVNKSKLEEEFANQLNDQLKEEPIGSRSGPNQVEELRNKGVIVMENPLFDSGAEQSKGGKSDKVPIEKTNVTFTEAPIAPKIKEEENKKGMQQQGVMKPVEERDFYVGRTETAEVPKRGMKPDYLDNNPINRMINAENHGTAKEGGKAVEGGERNPRGEGGGTKTVCENVPMNANMNRNGNGGVGRTQIAGEGKGKSVQGGRAVQGRFKQQNSAGGNGVTATEVRKGKEPEGNGNPQQIPTNISRNQDPRVSGKGNEGIADKAIWKPVKSGKFSFAAAKKFVGGEHRVNCLARALADRSGGRSVVYNAACSLLRGFHQLLALEGIPHFSWSPGLDMA